MFNLQKAFVRGARLMSTLQKQPINKATGLLSQTLNSAGRRYMGHGPDISSMEAYAYIFLLGGGFAAWGIYKTMQMKGRIEAYETGQVLPMKHLTDEEHFEMQRRVLELQGEEEDEPTGAVADEAQVEYETPNMKEDFQASQTINKSFKDKVIFIEAQQ